MGVPLYRWTMPEIDLRSVTSAAWSALEYVMRSDADEIGCGAGVLSCSLCCAGERIARGWAYV